ncbi:MAG: SH3 domain-containing protein [Nodosilinea sp.]
MARPIGPIKLGLCCALSVIAVGCRGGAPETETATDPNLPEEIAPVPEATGSPAPVLTPAPTTAPTAPPAQGAAATPINPPQKAQLIAAQPEAQINLRSQPTTESQSKGYGLVGDPVQLQRSTQGADGQPWYYVKFETSGAEGWIRGDFINTEGRATALPQQAAQGSSCEGLMEGTVFTAFYDANGFNLVRFMNLETKNTFDSSLSRQGSNNQGQPIYVGNASPPTGGSYAVQLTDLSGGTPRSQSQVGMNYNGITATGTCK